MLLLHVVFIAPTGSSGKGEGCFTAQAGAIKDVRFCTTLTTPLHYTNIIADGFGQSFPTSPCYDFAHSKSRTKMTIGLDSLIVSRLLFLVS